MEGKQNVDERIILKLVVSGTCLIWILTITMITWKVFMFLLTLNKKMTGYYLKI